MNYVGWPKRGELLNNRVSANVGTFSNLTVLLDHERKVRCPTFSPSLAPEWMIAVGWMAMRGQY